MRRTCLLVAALYVPELGADIILSAAGLNATLKKMERLRQTIATGAPAARADALFQLASEADALAALLNDEVAAHGSQEKLLIDLALARTGELGVAIGYNREKKKFFYDNAAFREYAALHPRGPRAADAAFKIVEGEFFQSSQTDIEAVRASSERKAAFLRRYPTYKQSSEVSLMLSIDYRDLFRHYQKIDDVANRDRYLALTRKQLSATASKYKGTEQAQIAAEILKRFEAQLMAK